MHSSTPLHPKRGSNGRPTGPTGMSKNIRPSDEEHRYNTISPRSNQARRESWEWVGICSCVCQLSAKATFLIPWISPGSSFVNAKHFAPRSFSDAPTRYKSLSSTIRNLSWNLSLYRMVSLVSDRRYHIKAIIFDLANYLATALVLNCRKFCDSWKHVPLSSCRTFRDNHRRATATDFATPYRSLHNSWLCPFIGCEQFEIT